MLFDLVLCPKYSVTPKNFLFRNFDFDIGPFIRPKALFFFKICNAMSKQLFIYDELFSQSSANIFLKFKCTSNMFIRLLFILL